MEATLRDIENPWDLIDPGDVLETKKFDTFLYFAKSKETSNLEILNADGTNITLMVKGSNEDGASKIFFTTPINRVSTKQKEEILEAFSKIQISDIFMATKRNRLVACIRAYFQLS